MLHTINTGHFKLDGGAMFGVVPKQIWNKQNPADNNNLCNWAMRCLLIEDGKRLILIDTGIGNKQDDRFFSHYHLNGDDSLELSLNAAGFTAADITDVFLTHLHFDHCGGCIIRSGGQLIPAFPNAIYWSNTNHWQWATEPNDREKASFLSENILPILQSGQLKFIDVEQDVAFSETISVRFVNGHTRDMMLPQIKYKNKTIIFVADLFPSIAHLPIAYVMAYDMFPLISLQEKKAFLAEGLEKNYILFFEHDPVSECCDVRITDKGIRQDNVFRLADI